jgi:hypothetical protein
VPISGERTIDVLVREGLVSPAKRHSRRRPSALATAGTVSDLVSDQRR